MNFRECLVVVLMGVFVLFQDARADRVDIIENMPDMDYCTVVADQFHAGALSQIGGSARKLTALTPMVVEIIEHGGKVPKDAMYVPEFNSLTDREKAWMETNVMEGYDEASKIKDLTDEQAIKMTQKVFEGCMYKRTANKRVNFIKTASSEMLGEVCKNRIFDINRIADAVANEVPQDHVIDVAKKSHLQADRLALILEMVDEAYSYSGNLMEWMKYRMVGCM